jgi:hypothetical protein
MMDPERPSGLSGAVLAQVALTFEAWVPACAGMMTPENSFFLFPWLLTGMTGIR